jgi:hypothetical protein
MSQPLSSIPLPPIRSARPTCQAAGSSVRPVDVFLPLFEDVQHAGEITYKPMLLGYACVSTVDQNLGLQRDALTGAGCTKIFTEQMSGAVTDRPALHDALEFARSGDTLIVWKLDRLTRSTTSRLPKRCWPTPTSASPKSRTASASHRRRSIGTSRPREPRIRRAFDNGRSTPKTGRSMSVSAWPRAAFGVE